MQRDLQPPERSYASLLWAALIVAAIAQLLIFFRSPVVASDLCTFLDMAKRMQDDPVAAMRLHDQHPGYPAIIVFSHMALGLLNSSNDTQSWIVAARMGPMICGILAIPVAWLFFRRTVGELAAGIAVLLLAVIPVARQVSADTTSDAPHLLLYLLAAWTASEGVAHRRLAWFALCGLFGGLAFWVRPEGLAVVAGLGLLTVASRGWRAHFGTRRAWCAAAIAVFAAAVVVVPYVVISGKISGKITSKPFWHESRFSSDARCAAAPLVTLVDGSGEQHTAPWDTPAYRKAMANFKPRFATGIGTAIAKLCESLRFGLLLPLLIGVVVALRTPQPIASSVSTAAIAVHAVLVVLLCFLGGQVSHRHVLPISVFLLQGVAIGLVHMGRWAPLWTRGRVSIRASLVCATAIGMMILLPRCLRPLHAESLHIAEVARWLKAEAASDDVVVTNHDLVLVYAGMPYRHIDLLRPNLEIQLDDATFASRHRYVVLGEIGNFDPAWLDRLQKYYAPVCEMRSPQGKTPIVIYEHRLLAAVRPAPQVLK